MNPEEYKKLLERAYSSIDPEILQKARWSPPEIKIEIQGNRTVITNFGEICKSLRRDPEHLSKYFSKSLAAPTLILGDRLIIQGKKFIEDIKSRYEYYIKNYVLCPICSSCDTVIIKEGRYWILKCEACGAKSPVKEF